MWLDCYELLDACAPCLMHVQEQAKLYLSLDDLAAAQHFPGMSAMAPTRPPLFVLDVQHLLLQAFQGHTASFKPR